MPRIGGADQWPDQGIQGGASGWGAQDVNVPVSSAWSSAPINNDNNTRNALNPSIANAWGNENGLNTGEFQLEVSLKDIFIKNSDF